MESIHNWNGRLQAAEKTLNRLSPGNLLLIKKFEDHCFSTGISVPRIVKYLHHVKNIARLLGKDLDKATKQDIERVVVEIEKSEYTTWTKHDYKVALKKFYKWLRPQQPELTDWIKPSVKRNRRSIPEQLPTAEEVFKMVSAAETPRDKALIILLYESGARIGEIGSLKIKDLEFYENYTALHLKGKTGPRRIIVVLSTPYLQNWLKHHPYKDQPEAPLWITMGNTTHGRKMSYQAIYRLLLKTARQAKIKKKVNPHNFRHAQLTELAKELTEFQLAQYAGWVPDTRMASVYVHLAGRDLDAAILRKHGLTKPENESNNKVKPRTCPRCGVVNALEAKYCQRCGLILDVATALEKDRRIQLMQQTLPILVKILKEVLEKAPEAKSAYASELESLEEILSQEP